MTVTAPGMELDVGQRFLVVAGPAYERAQERELRRASLSFAVWQSRLCLPASASSAVVPDSVRLAEAVELGLVHKSLVESPDQLAA